MMLQVREAAQELGYQPDETFCLKVSQLREIFAVRWSVFLLGPAGCGKTAIWRTLMRAQQLLGERTVYKPINPKANRSLVLLSGCAYMFSETCCTIALNIMVFIVTVSKQLLTLSNFMSFLSVKVKCRQTRIILIYS